MKHITSYTLERKSCLPDLIYVLNPNTIDSPHWKVVYTWISPFRLNANPDWFFKGSLQRGMAVEDLFTAISVWLTEIVKWHVFYDRILGGVEHRILKNHHFIYTKFCLCTYQKRSNIASFSHPTVPSIDSSFKGLQYTALEMWRLLVLYKESETKNLTTAEFFLTQS